MSYLLMGVLCIYVICLMQYTRKLVRFIRARHPEFIMVRHPEVFESIDRPCFWFLNCRICLDLYILRGWNSLNDQEVRKKVNRFYAMSWPCIALGFLWAAVAYRSIQVSEYMP